LQEGHTEGHPIGQAPLATLVGYRSMLQAAPCATRPCSLVPPPLTLHESPPIGPRLGLISTYLSIFALFLGGLQDYCSPPILPLFCSWPSNCRRAKGENFVSSTFRSCVFCFFIIIIFSTALASYSQQCHQLDFLYDSSIFSYILLKLHVLELFDGHLPQQKKFHLIHTSISRGKICAPFSQLPYDVIPQCGSPQK
jgi:hypothetical protein